MLAPGWNEKATGIRTVVFVIMSVFGAVCYALLLANDARAKTPKPVSRIWFDRAWRPHVR
jgi:hypothetical protein